MRIIEVSTNKEYSVEIVPVESNDYKSLKKDRYFFDWKTEKKEEVYKLRIIGSNEILGLVSIERIPQEWRLHIRLLSVSKENKGKEKQFDNITGNLIAHIAKIAVREYGELAYVSLKPKIQIAKHYIEKYNMNVTGVTFSIDVPDIIDLINKYDKD
jgi:hypothetical protein